MNLEIGLQLLLKKIMHRFYFNEVKNPIELIIIGDGPEKKNVEKTINSIKMLSLIHI